MVTVSSNKFTSLSSLIFLSEFDSIVVSLILLPPSFLKSAKTSNPKRSLDVVFVLFAFVFVVAVVLVCAIPVAWVEDSCDVIGRTDCILPDIAM